MRLIDVDAITEEQKQIHGFFYDYDLDELLKECPTIEANPEVKPIITAQWELVRYDPDYLQWSAKCTNCNNRHESNENVGRLPFCPHCGAAMQGERVPKLISAEEE